MQLSGNALAFVYLVSGALFILGLNRLSHPSTARRGNFYAITGMLLAIIATLLHPDVKSYTFIVPAMIIGAVIGIVVALRIHMAAMPQLVALLHSFVGLAAVLVAVGTYLNHAHKGVLTGVFMTEVFIGAFIGAITFTGSLIAFGKLQGLVTAAPVAYIGQHWLNLVLGLVMLGFGIDFAINDHFSSLLILIGIAFLLGVLLIIPIGGADMPVIISMLNSYSGWAAAATGFTLENKLLIITGAIVGFCGAILSYIMCRAMNRSFISVILGGFGTGDAVDESGAVAATQKGVKSSSVEDAAFLLENASKVIIVPGYGMAVAQAQHALKELVERLEDKGAEVKFAIHPVAGRMPGHMNVLLAEADVPYDLVFEMDEINPEFNSADVALVVGANDVTNPAAKRDRASPIYGMPILDVDKAKHVFFIKRSMRPGYAGIDNLLFYQDNCSLLFGDAKAVCEKTVAELKAA
ncbi:MAG: NAD(P)(+) transhydrogenase (Re/Si-specific) subunit beta [Acidiferrobacterales bacterium]